MLPRNLKVFLSVLIVFAFLASIAETQKLSRKDATSRIVNGTIIPIENAPFMVQIRKTSDNFTSCGGTLLSLQHVLTAAHCVEWTDEDRIKRVFKVVAGVSLRNETGVERNISNFYIHPNRTIPYGADVAILKLDKPFEESAKIKAHTKFCTSLPTAGSYVRVTGWGVTKSVIVTNSLLYNDFSKELRFVRLPIISNEECLSTAKPAFDRKIIKHSYEGFTYGINTSLVCTYKQYYDACLTDSGGPVMYRDELCAVVSGGFGCAYGGYPAYYTSIPAVLDFINEKLTL